MSAPSEIAVAFEAWKLAELTCHYAAPCPDEMMDRLTSAESAAFDALQGLVPRTADDFLLQLFPVMLREFEPTAGKPPLRLCESRSYNYDDDFISCLNHRFGFVSPAIAAAIAEPLPVRDRRVAA